MEKFFDFTKTKLQRTLLWIYAIIEIAFFVFTYRYFRMSISIVSTDLFIFGAIVLLIMLLSIVLYFTSLMSPNIKPGRAIFLMFIFVNYLGIMGEAYSITLDGIASMRGLHVFIMFAGDIINELIVLLAWCLARSVFYGDLNVPKNADRNIFILVIIFTCAMLLNLKFGWFHKIDGNGSYVASITSGFYYLQLIIPFLYMMKAFYKSKVTHLNRIVFCAYYLSGTIGLIGDEYLGPYGVLYFIILFCIQFIIFGSIVTSRETEMVARELAIASTEKELVVASNMQNNMLPINFKSFEQYGVDVYGSMHAAKEVGGDFYDFFSLDENRTAYLIGDVSGKGVPAALFMTVGKTLLQKSITEMESLAEAITSVHRILCASNAQDMFITLWAAVLDTKNDKLTYVNAAHTKTYVKFGDEGYKQLSDLHGTMLGCVLAADREYKESVIDFHPGDKIFMYTDGVTEANNENGEMYETNRLEGILEEYQNDTSDALATAVFDDVKNFQGDAEQFDDITMLAMHYEGKSNAK